MMSEQTGAPRRSTYRHGNLRQALVAAGVELARTGGPEAVALRAATRSAGVSPNAAYRHFADRDALVHAVSLEAMAALARTMEAERQRLHTSGSDPVQEALARFRAVGTGYLRFACVQRGLFRAAFFVPADMSQAEAAPSAGADGRTPFQLLGAALDDLVSCGRMPVEHRPGAEFLIWSCMHGLAVLLIDGPLRGLPDARIEQAGRDLIGMIERGL
ncbi:TetR/AcrR family transcriptional regulator [Actinomadura hibisca]|uniref:TetR/AcrR family transcriptional regulator n=1 Tax=Actinomadura hibisca TaxID=68565 RepID=UPI00082FC3FA|nr:TetR/AcrR family transcriptional regulator [Actinomadura hibisca]